MDHKSWYWSRYQRMFLDRGSSVVRLMWPAVVAGADPHPTGALGDGAPPRTVRTERLLPKDMNGCDP